MIIENNNWFCTDPDFMQHCQKISETEFRFIQAVWLDTCGDDIRARHAKDESDNYAVCAGYIDLNLYSNEDIECALSCYRLSLEPTYYYNRTPNVYTLYEKDANQIIARCLFEEGETVDRNCISGVVSWDDAEEIIQNYIDVK